MLRFGLPRLKKMAEGSSVNRHYKPWFADAADVARNVAHDFDRLAGGTRLWNKTWYDSTVPVWLLDRSIVPVDTLATQTFFWFDNSRPWGGEGVDSCEGTCTYVWSYAQAMARLFPELERGLREITDCGVAFDPTTGVIILKTWLLTGRPEPSSARAEQPHFQSGICPVLADLRKRTEELGVQRTEVEK